MKKLLSSLMIGLIATTATMSAMAAPAQDHRNPPPAKFDKKPLPPKSDMRKDFHKSQFNPQKNDGKFDKKGPQPDFNKKAKPKMQKQGKPSKYAPERKAPPKPMPAHR